MDDETITLLLTGETRVVETKALKPNPDNPKDISKGMLDRLTDSLGHLGYLIPILVNKKLQIIDGHQRLKALVAMGYERVEVRIVDLDEDKELLALLATDQTYGTFNRTKRQDIYNLLEAREAKLSILADYIERKDKLKEALRDELPATPVENREVQYGDVIQLGRHTLICGDSSDPSIHALIKEKHYLLLTSPPYFNQREEYSSWESLEAYLQTMAKVMELSTKSEDMVAFVNIGMDLAFNLPAKFDEILEDCGLSYLDCICWLKSNLNMNIPRFKQIRSHNLYYPTFQWEPCLVYTRGERHKFNAVDTNYIHENYLSNVWKFTTVRNEKRWHPAPYPIELAKTAIQVYTESGDVVLDPFLGSGTTLFACEELGRTCIGIEMSSEYCQHILEDWNGSHSA